ncbi:hypothetical protein Tco_0320201 [Tanacetum coccineum]
MRFIPKHKTAQNYGVILPDTLTNQAIKESEAYKTYYDLATGKKSSDEEDDDEVSMSKDDDDNVDNVDTDDQDDDNEQTKSDNDGDDFVHPKYSTHDVEESQDKEEEWSDLRVHTPSHFETTNDEAYDDVTQGDNVKEEKLDEEETNEEEEVNELYRDVNVNLERRDTEMTDALLTNVQGTQVIEDTHVIITSVTPEVQQQSSSVSSDFISNMLNPNPDTGINSILNLNTESTSLVDVPITTNVEIPPSSVTTLPQPPIPLIQPLQQTPVPTPTIVPSTSLQNLPTFGSLFKFEDRVKALEDDFSEFKQTNLFAKAVSSTPGIVDTYLANKMNEVVKEAVQLQIEKLLNEQLKAEVLTRSSNEAKTSYVVAANLSELELKKILIDKMENNKSIERSVQHKTLYKALVDAYETNKVILKTYGDTVTLKRRRDDEDEDEEPSTGSNRGSKRRRVGKKPDSTSAPKEKTSKSTSKSKEGSKSHQKSTDKSAQVEEPIHTTTQLPDWFQKPTKPPTLDHDWNKTFPAIHGPIQPWIITLAWNEDPHESFNELMDTPLDFSAFVLNRLKIDTLTLELLAGSTFELMKGSCKSLVELEYFLEEVCKATTDQLDWNNPEVQQYPHDLLNKESTRNVYSRHRILAVTKLKIVEWHNYKYLD